MRSAVYQVVSLDKYDRSAFAAATAASGVVVNADPASHALAKNAMAEFMGMDPGTKEAAKLAHWLWRVPGSDESQHAVFECWYTTIQVLAWSKDDAHRGMWFDQFGEAASVKTLDECDAVQLGEILEAARNNFERNPAHASDLEEGIRAAVRAWTSGAARTILSVPPTTEWSKRVLGVLREILKDAVSYTRPADASDSIDAEIKNGFVDWIYKKDRKGDKCGTARRIRDARRKLDVVASEDAKVADRMARNLGEREEGGAHYTAEEKGVFRGKYDSKILTDLKNPPCLPQVLEGSAIDVGYVEKCCCHPNSFVARHEKEMAKWIVDNDSLIKKAAENCLFLAQYQYGKKNIGVALGASGSAISELFHVTGGKWRPADAFFTSTMAVDDIAKFTSTDPIDQIHAYVLWFSIRNNPKRAESSVANGAQIKTKAEWENENEIHTVNEIVGRVSALMGADSPDLQEIEERYVQYKALVQKVDGDVFKELGYVHPSSRPEFTSWQAHVTEAEALTSRRVRELEARRAEDAADSSGPASSSSTATHSFGAAAAKADPKAASNPFETLPSFVGIHAHPGIMAKSYVTLSSAQKLDHAYAKRIFGYAGLLWMLGERAIRDSEAETSINATIMHIDLAAFKTAKGLVAEWRASTRPAGALMQKYIGKAVESGIYEWELGVHYFVGRMIDRDDSLKALGAWMITIQKERKERDDEYLKPESGATAMGIAALVFGKLAVDLFVVADDKAQTVQDEADVMLARKTADVIGALAKASGAFPDAARYYPLAQVTRLADATLGAKDAEPAREQVAVVVLAMSIALLDMIGFETARMVCEYIAAVERQLAHDVADVMELVAKFVEDNNMVVLLTKAAREAKAIVSGAARPRELVLLLAKLGKLKAEHDSVSVSKPKRSGEVLAALADAMRGLNIVSSGRKVHTSIRVRADALRSFGDKMHEERDGAVRVAARVSSTRLGEPTHEVGDADIERARASRRDLLGAMRALNKRTLQITGGEVLVVQQEARDGGTAHVRVEVVVPGMYLSQKSHAGAFDARFVGVSASVIGNATSWRGKFTGVCLVLVDEGPKAMLLRDNLHIGSMDGWRPIARALRHASVDPKSAVVVMRAPDPKKRDETLEIAAAPVVVLVVDEGLARSLETALVVALEYAEEGAESGRSRAASVYSKQLGALMRGKEPRVCGATLGGEAAPVPGAKWSGKPGAKEEARCIVDAMILEYRIVRDTVRVFGLGAKLAKSLDWDGKDKEAVPDLVVRFSAWNYIAGQIAEGTLGQMVELRTKEMGKGRFDATFEERRKMVEGAWIKTQTLIKNEPKPEALAVLDHPFLEGEDQIVVKAALARGSLPELERLVWKGEAAMDGASAKKTPENVAERIKARLEAEARFRGRRGFV